MPSRSFTLGFAAATLLAAGVFLGVQFGQPRTADAAPKEDGKPYRAGYVCVPELMKGYEKWQDRARLVEEKRQAGAKELIRVRDGLERKSKAMEGVDPEQKAKLEKELREERRKFEDAEAAAKEELETESKEHLTELFADISDMVERLAEERGLAAVHLHPAHPKRVFEQNKGSEQRVIDLMMRTPAVNPVYLREDVDLTADLVRRLNAKADREKK